MKAQVTFLLFFNNYLLHFWDVQWAGHWGSTSNNIHFMKLLEKDWKIRKKINTLFFMERETQDDQGRDGKTSFLPEAEQAGTRNPTVVCY